MTAHVATMVSAEVGRGRRTRRPGIDAPAPVAGNVAPSRHDVAVATAATLAGVVGLGIAALVALLLTMGAVGEGGANAAAPGGATIASSTK